jgi:hypothetical protein
VTQHFANHCFRSLHDGDFFTVSPMIYSFE